MGMCIMGNNSNIIEIIKLRKNKVNRWITIVTISRYKMIISKLNRRKSSDMERFKTSRASINWERAPMV